MAEHIVPGRHVALGELFGCVPGILLRPVPCGEVELAAASQSVALGAPSYCVSLLWQSEQARLAGVRVSSARPTVSPSRRMETLGAKGGWPENGVKLWALRLFVTVARMTASGRVTLGCRL